jgi:hypothetical protein
MSSRWRRTVIAALLFAVVALGVVSSASATSGWHYNGGVGINVIGTGLKVTEIQSSYWVPAYSVGCATAWDYDTMGYLSSHLSSQKCWTAHFSWTINADWIPTPARTLPNGDSVCTYWLVDGYNYPNDVSACVTIHS